MQNAKSKLFLAFINKHVTIELEQCAELSKMEKNSN